MAASNSLTPEQRAQRARIAAYSRWSRHADRKAAAEKAQSGLLERFRQEVLTADPDVAEPELTVRAKALRKAHMVRLAFQSSKARTPDNGEAA